MSLDKAWKHFVTISTHKKHVAYCCFKMGLVWQGLIHDMSKYSPVEFRAGARYYQGDRSPNNKEREVTGVSPAWLHHKGRNKHHFEYWIDYSVGAKTMIAGAPMPRRYVAEMVADRIAASKVYLRGDYSDLSPYVYFSNSAERLWFVHDEVKEQLFYLLGMLAIRGEDRTFRYIRKKYLADISAPWTRPADFDKIKRAADKVVASDEKTRAFIKKEENSNHVMA